MGRERERDRRPAADAADARGGTDGVRARETGESWEDWDEATLPRLVLGRLEHVCRLTPAAHAAPLLSVVAALAWWCGDGARAGVAVDHALDLEPDHRLSDWCVGRSTTASGRPAAREPTDGSGAAGASMSWNGRSPPEGVSRMV